MTERTGGEWVVEALRAEGVRHVFGIPGIHNLAIYDALLRQSDITHVLARHEAGAGFMADGYARASGQPGVSLVTTGPGAEEDLERVGLVVREPEVRPEAVLDLLAWAARVGRGLRDRVAQLGADIGQELDEELPLGREVLVQHGLRHARRLGHVVHRRGVVAVLREDGHRGVQELLSSFRRRKSHVTRR